MKKKIIIIASLLALVMVFGAVASVFNTSSVKLPSKNSTGLSQYIVKNYQQASADCSSVAGYSYEIYEESNPYYDYFRFLVIENISEYVDLVTCLSLSFGEIALCITRDESEKISAYKFSNGEISLNPFIENVDKLIIFFDDSWGEIRYYNDDGSYCCSTLDSSGNFSTLYVLANSGSAKLDITSYAFPVTMLNSFSQPYSQAQIIPIYQSILRESFPRTQPMMKWRKLFQVQNWFPYALPSR